MVSLTAWFKRHFALGIILSGAVGSIVAWTVIERKWPWFLAPVNGVAMTAWAWAASTWIWTVGITPVYRWWYSVLLLYLIATLAGLAYMLFKRYAASPGERQPEIQPHQYAQDIFFQAVWRWKYSQRGDDIEALTPFCPQCDRTLERGRADTSTRGWIELHNTLECREHQVIYATYEPYARFKEIIKDEIRLKLRNGAWKQVVERLKVSG